MKYFVIGGIFFIAVICILFFMPMENLLKHNINMSEDTSQKTSSPNPLPDTNKESSLLEEAFWKTATLDEVKQALEKEKNIPNLKDDKNQTPLHYCAQYGQHPSAVVTLINAGVNPEVTDLNRKLTAFHLAVIRKSKAYDFALEFVKLYRNIIDIQSPFHGSTPLILAAYDRSPLKVIKLLLDNKADVHKKNFKGSTALIAASAPNQFWNINFIDPQTIQILLDYGSDITVKNNDGMTALDFMKKNKQFRETDLFKRLSKPK